MPYTNNRWIKSKLEILDMRCFGDVKGILFIIDIIKVFND